MTVSRPLLGYAPTGLPVEAVRPLIEAEVLGGAPVIIRAEPGAGKTSLVPLFVADALASDQRVILTQPRRMAARAAATRLAELLGEPVGRRIGLTIRGERAVSAATRIEVVTEAVLTNRLQRHLDLPGVGAIVLDEFHERSLHLDLGLAMALEVRAALRDDLRLVIMSATLETDRMRAVTGARTVIDVPGRTFAVTTEHHARPGRREVPETVATVIGGALRKHSGDILAFVPGRREIDEVLTHLDRAARTDTALAASERIGLHASTSIETQRAVLRGGNDRRRVIVATAVAETSITVPGIGVVVDGGLLRRARFDPATGLGRLDTVHATQFAAEQRRGRAGRLGPGHCIRLWTMEDHRHLDPATPPEIVDGDPLPVAFELARWGDPWAETLTLLDHPGRSRLQAAQRILRQLGLTNESGRLTARGNDAAPLGLHPRLAALVQTAASLDLVELGLRTATLLDNDAWPNSCDLAIELTQRWSTLSSGVRQLSRRLGAAKSSGTAETARSPGSIGSAGSEHADLGRLLAMAWPDRVAMARTDRPGRFLMAAGREVMLDPGDPLARSPFLAVVQADGDPRAARVRLAVGIDRTTVLDACADHIEWVDHVEWDQRDDTLRAERRQRLGSIVLHRQPLANPPVEAIGRALGNGLRTSGLGLLRWGERGVALRARLAWLHGQAPDHWPDLSDTVLLDRLDEWLDLSRCRSIDDLRRIDPTSALRGLLDWQQRRSLDELAPTTMEPPRGRARPVDYASGRPVWSVRIQHLFGLDQHPRIGPNHAPVTIELLSPANRPAQITTDLPGFWRGSYAAVRADLRGRYPKHDWPENPLPH